MKYQIEEWSISECCWGLWNLSLYTYIYLGKWNHHSYTVDHATTQTFTYSSVFNLIFHLSECDRTQLPSMLSSIQSILNSSYAFYLTLVQNPHWILVSWGLCNEILKIQIFNSSNSNRAHYSHSDNHDIHRFSSGHHVSSGDERARVVRSESFGPNNFSPEL